MLQDGGVENQETKATMVLSLDEKRWKHYVIDLWTKDMPVDQMKMFLHQIFVSLWDHTYQKEQLAKMM